MGRAYCASQLQVWNAFGEHVVPFLEKQAEPPAKKRRKRRRVRKRRPGAFAAPWRRRRKKGGRKRRRRKGPAPGPGIGKGPKRN